MNWTIELVIVPVSDVDRAKKFYTENVGFNLDVDMQINDAMRVVQATPPGSACSIGFGMGITDSIPGSLKGLHLVVPDIEAARAELVGRGTEVSAIRHMEGGNWVDGPSPNHGGYESFADFQDPDGNTWVLQEVPQRASEA